MALIAGGLLVHSFLNLARVDPGYEPAHLLTFSVRSSTSAGRSRFCEEVAARLRGLPGVKAVGYAEILPMVRFRTGGPLDSRAIDAGGHTAAARGDRHARRESRFRRRDGHEDRGWAELARGRRACGAHE